MNTTATSIPFGKQEAVRVSFEEIELSQQDGKPVYRFEESVAKTVDEQIEQILKGYGVRTITTNHKEDRLGADRWLVHGDRILFADFKCCSRIHKTGNVVIETKHVSVVGGSWSGWAYRLDYIDCIAYYDTVGHVLYMIPTQRIDENLTAWEKRPHRSAKNDNGDGRPYDTLLVPIPLEEILSLRGVRVLKLTDVPIAKKDDAEPWKSYEHRDLRGKNKIFSAPDADRIIRVTDRLGKKSYGFSPHEERHRAKYQRYESLFPGLKTMNDLPRILRQSVSVYRVERRPHGSILSIGNHQWNLHHEHIRGSGPKSDLLRRQTLSRAIVSDTVVRAEIVHSLERATNDAFRNIWT